MIIRVFKKEHFDFCTANKQWLLADLNFSLEGLVLEGNFFLLLKKTDGLSVFFFLVEDPLGFFDLLFSYRSPWPGVPNDESSS